MQPKVMLFDELTSALDPELTGEVLLVIERLAKSGMTMLLVTHEMNFARRIADTTVFMHEGKVWETGPSADVVRGLRAKKSHLPGQLARMKMRG